MIEQGERLSALLRGFDERTDAFTEFEVETDLQGLLKDIRDAGGEAGPDLMAELIASAFVEDYQHRETGWGTYHGPMIATDGWEYPSLPQITRDVLDYWASRARSASHPVFQARYAGLVWDFQAKVQGYPRSPDIPHILIDATARTAALELVNYQVRVIEKLRRGLSVALSLRDQGRVGTMRDAILAFEDRIGEDRLPGLWGFSFDLLIEENKKVPLSEAQERKIIGDLEGRLRRLTDGIDPPHLDPHSVQWAALRLARYYRRSEQIEDVARVLGIYAKAFLDKGNTAPGMTAAAWLRDAHSTLLAFNLREAAATVSLLYQDHARRGSEEMKTMTFSQPIDPVELATYLEGMTSGDLETVLMRFVVRYLPTRAEAERQVRENARSFVASHLCGQTLVDHEGRAVAAVGTVGTDLEGHTVRQLSQTLSFTGLFVRMVIEKLVAEQRLTLETFTGFAYLSPLFDPARRPIIETGLRAYFDGQWVVAIHLLVPQIENAVRRLVESAGGATLKKGRSGAMMIRNLDELLRDERAIGILTEDGAGYLQVLLTDPRGWNVRNNVCHGLTRTEDFGPAIADRLLHALLLLGALRVASGDQTGEEPARGDGQSS